MTETGQEQIQPPVVAVTGGPESETLVRRASRIASKSSAQLMVVHVARGDGLSGVSPREMGKVRELAASLGATVHVVVGEDVSTALLDFARETNATQLVLGSSCRNQSTAERGNRLVDFTGLRLSPPR